MKNVAEFRGRVGAVAAQQNASYVVRVWRAMQRISSMSSGAIGMVVRAAGAIGMVVSAAGVIGGEDGVAVVSGALVGA
jgi:hypothetical protein